MRRQSKSIVVLTGAGISAESGLPTFRDKDGLWEGQRVEDVACPEAFARDPERVQRFYNLRRAALNGVTPNAAHHALARLQQAWPGRFTLITQNVDDLHERAGSTEVIHMHGELRQARCGHCGRRMEWLDELHVAIDRESLVSSLSKRVARQDRFTPPHATPSPCCHEQAPILPRSRRPAAQRGHSTPASRSATGHVHLPRPLHRRCRRLKCRNSRRRSQTAATTLCMGAL